MHLRQEKATSAKPRHVYCRGFTLVELMIALVIMSVVTLGAVQLSANVFRSNTQSIQMIQLSQEMRSVIQLISRDIRRAGYDDDALAGFLTTEAITSGVSMGSMDDDNISNCLRVQYDNLAGDAMNVVYRMRTVNDIGRVSAHFGAMASCATDVTDDGWVDVTDPLLTHISGLEFRLNDQMTDIAENLSNGHVIQVGLQQISIAISAILRTDNTINRTIINEVQIRNQFLTV
jgi:type II secretion system protein J